MALVSANRKRVVVEGPICNSSKVVGWLFRDLASDKIGLGSLLTDADMKAKPPRINISGFAFNSSILWDPERWGRATSVPDTSQVCQSVQRLSNLDLKGLRCHLLNH